MYAYHFDGYWKDVGTIPSLWEANMEVLDPEHSGINLFDENWKIYSRNSGMTGHKIAADGAMVENSMITDGCHIARHRTAIPSSLQASRWKKAPWWRMPLSWAGLLSRSGAVVKHCIVAENVLIGENAVVGAMPDDD